jgi:lipoprotein-releasing system ATP-binding protein
MEMLITLKSVYKTYKLDAQEVDALRGVDLAIPKGTICSITGPSGSGKSTLLHIIGTLDRPTNGIISINSTNVATLSDQMLSVFRNCTIGFVFQMNNLLPEFSALENVMLPGIIAGSADEAVRDRAHSLLKSVGLAHRSSHRPGELSGGEQQRVAIARALLMAPPILLADEPTGNLDKKTSASIEELLMNLCHENGVTMLMVTHDPSLASRLPNAICMEDGKIISTSFI